MPIPSDVVYIGETITLDDVVAVARANAPVALASTARERIAASRAWVADVVARGEPVIYGLNTGFGIFANVRVSSAEIRELMRNLILSHAVGVGEALPTESVRATMLIRANTLAQGYSGVRLELIETLIEMLNRGVHPIIPAKGSVGASGDLAPLAHLALVLSAGPDEREEDSGEAFFQGERTSGKLAMQRAGIPRLTLEAKEGLALSNGAAVSAALAALACYDALNLLEHSCLAVALTLEALRGASAAFDARIHASARHPGQQRVAARVRALIRNSGLLDRAGWVQDAYSIRCAPQVLGAAADALEFARARLEEEINAATDNPLVFIENGQGTALSGGNFHGETVALAAGLMSMAVAELGNISERRTFRLLDGKLNDGLPMMLVERGGLNSGLMMAQVTAAALVSENKTLAHPDVLDSIPTSANQEDHVPMAMNAARHLSEIIWNTEQVLAIELLTATQAIDLRLWKEGRTAEVLGEGTRAVYHRLRQEIPFLSGDRRLDRDLARVVDLLRRRELIRLVTLLWSPD